MVRLSQGLSMRPLEDSEIWRKVGAYPDDKWWTVEHSVSYKSTELSFLETVQLGRKETHIYWDFNLKSNHRLPGVHGDSKPTSMAYR